MVSCIDKFGRPVAVGSRVRLVQLSPSFLKSLPGDEREQIVSMIGKVFEVTEIDGYGCAWVGKGWSNPDAGEYVGHSLGLDTHEMELVDER